LWQYPTEHLKLALDVPRNVAKKSSNFDSRLIHHSRFERIMMKQQGTFRLITYLIKILSVPRNVRCHCLGVSSGKVMMCRWGVLLRIEQ